MHLQQIVFASSNPGKIKELNELLTPLGFDVVSQEVFGISAADETAHTFVENALLKARHATALSGKAAIADDSGIEVDALDGAPGLYSARHAERHDAGRGDVANYELLLRQLQPYKDKEQRRGRFRTVVVFLRHAEDPAPLIAEATWEGHILQAPEGVGGFGYDPVFCSDDTGVAAALLDKQTKNRLSHRGKAVAKLVDMLSTQPSHKQSNDPGAEQRSPPGTQRGTQSGA